MPSEDKSVTDLLAPGYWLLNQYVPPEEYTEEIREIIAAGDTELILLLGMHGFGSPKWTEIPGMTSGILKSMEIAGYWARVTTPFTKDDLYSAGFTEQGVTGWNGTPDHHVRDKTLFGAVARAALLTAVHHGWHDVALVQRQRSEDA